MLLSFSLVLGSLSVTPDTVPTGGSANSTPPVEIVDASRRVYGQTFGFDYEYDDGTASGDETLATGPWAGVADAELVDYWGFDVGQGLAVQNSSIDSSSVTFDLVAHADTDGNHFTADSQGIAELTTELAFPQRVRVALVATTAATNGYNAAEVTLWNGAGRPIAQAASSPWVSGAAASVTFVGWLEPGLVELEVAASAQAGGSSGQPDAHAASALGSLGWFAEADFDVDGDVDQRDLRLFRAAFRADSELADFDGDGSVGSADFIGFVRAWRAS